MSANRPISRRRRCWKPSGAMLETSPEVPRRTVERLDLRICVVLTAGLGILLTSCSRSGAQAENSSKPADVPTVAVAQVTTEDLARNLVLTAEFKPYQEVEVMAKVAGYIKLINVDVGDRVKRGQLLPTLEIPEMA